MLVDTHIHTSFSFDCEMDLEDAVKAAKAMDIGITITDHLDLDMDFEPFDPAYYAEIYGPHRSERLFLGTECGMDLRFAEESREYLSVSAPDFILGSVHNLVDDDIYEASTFEKYEEQEFWDFYFSYTRECLENHPFIDSLGHIDYPARRRPYGVNEFSFKRHEQGLVPIYEFLAKREIALELNLRRFSEDTMAEFKEHFSAFKEMGGRYVTLGSDAHYAGPIGRNARKASGLLKSLDLNPVHYYRHEPVIDSLL